MLGVAEQMSKAERARLYEIATTPDLFAERVLGHDLWDMQRVMLRAIAVPRARVAVKACHASSKTFTAADAALWFMSRYRDGTVITTAPTWTQVKRLLWPEIRQAAEGRFADITMLTAEMRGPGGEDNKAFGMATNRGLRFQGFHGRVLVIVDEAPGVEAPIWQAIDGIRAGGDVRVLALGNPTISGGVFYEAFTAPRSTWTTLTISAFDTPNLAGVTLDDLLAFDDDALDVDARPYLVTRRWVKEKYLETGGAGHPEWDGRVAAEFPQAGANAAFPLALVDAAAARRLVAADDDPLIAGVDVAGPGEDETVVYLRAAGAILDLVTYSGDALDRVIAWLTPYRERLATIHVDEVGIGYYFAQGLRAAGFVVDGVNVGTTAKEPERFANRKAEAYWLLRERMQQARIGNLDDEPTRRQLTSVLYQTNAHGQIVIEDKAAYRKRAGASPDRAEALILAFLPAIEPPVATTYAPIVLPKVSITRQASRGIVIPTIPR